MIKKGLLNKLIIFGMMFFALLFSVLGIQDASRSWTFNTDVYDGYNVENGTLVGHANIVTSTLFGGTGYLLLDGASDYVKLRWIDNHSITNGSFSVRTWFMKDNAASEDVLMSYLRVADGNSEGYRMWLTNTGKLQVNFWNGTTGNQMFNNSNASITTGKIYEVHFVFNMSDSKARIYLNGTLDNEWFTAGQAPSFGIRMCHSIGAGFYYGTSPCSQLEKDMEGKIWNSAEWFGYALTSSEVAADFANKYQLPLAPLTLSITQISPAEHSTSNQKLNVTYNVTIDSSCSLYIENKINQTDSTVENSTTQFFYVSDMNNDGTYHYYINCTSVNGLNSISTERHYHYHIDSPLINMYAPNHDNSTIFTTQSINFVGNISDTNLTQVNETIKSSTGTTLFSNNTLFASGTTFLNLAKTIDASSWGEGTFYYNVYAKDEAGNPSIENISFQIKLLKLTIISPANNTRSNQPLEIFYNASKNHYPTLACSLWINGSISQTNTSVNDNVISSFYTSLSGTQILSWQIGCTDIESTNESGIYFYNFDNVQPFVHWFSPSYYNTTIVDTNLSFHVDVTDDYLYRVNTTIYAPNSSVLYNNYSGNLVNGTTNYSIQKNIITSVLPQGVYTVVMEGADSHTGKAFEIVDAIQEIPEESKYKIQLEKDAPEFVVSDGLAMDFMQQDDRISFVMTADSAERKSFTFKTDEPLVKIENSKYPCHYVFGDYWFDCEGLENPTATLQNDNELLIEFDVPAEPESEIPQGELIAKNVIGEDKIKAGGDELVVSMKSLGGLNENREVATFVVDHCDSVWTCDSYTACNEYGQQVCNHTIDVALCGYSYTGNYSEFTQQVCTDDMFAYWDMELNNANWFRDLSGNNRQLICLKEGGIDCSDMQQTNGLIGKAAGDFSNGGFGVINTSMSTPVVNALNQNTSFSIVMWVNVKQYDMSNKTLFYAHNYNNINGTMDIQLQYEQQQSNWKFGLRTFLNNSNAAWTFAEGYHLATVNNWNMIVATFDTQSNTMSLYINNQLVDTAVFADNMNSPSYSIYTIGRDGVYGTHGSSNVWIDETGIFTKALTTSEIETLSNRGLGCTYPFTSCPSMFNYATEDLPIIIFDIFGTAGAVFISFIPVIIILGLIIVVIKYWKKHK
jgi:hypothetical protein